VIVKKTMLPVLLLTLACVFSGFEQLHAGVQKDVEVGLQRDVDEMEHALGWDTLDLKVLQTGGHGPTLERNTNAVNRISRTTSYFDNGEKAKQEVTVVDKSNEKTLYCGKKSWNSKGDLTKSYEKDDAFNGDGKQVKGHIVDSVMLHGRLVTELRKSYSPTTDSWGVTLKQQISYYDDGDMRERVTLRPAADEKTREHWSNKDRLVGRKEVTSSWDSSSGKWN
jgi:hypothetical protein